MEFLILFLMKVILVLFKLGIKLEIVFKLKIKMVRVFNVWWVVMEI